MTYNFNVSYHPPHLYTKAVVAAWPSIECYHWRCPPRHLSAHSSHLRACSLPGRHASLSSASSSSEAGCMMLYDRKSAHSSHLRACSLPGRHASLSSASSSSEAGCMMLYDRKGCTVF